MEIRVILALCVVVGSTMCGKSLSGAARRRVELLKALIDGVKILKVHMVSMFEPVQISLSQSECALMAQIGNHMQSGVSAGVAWQAVKKEARRKGGQADALNLEDHVLLDRFFEHLGESGREAQEILLSSTVESLEQHYDQARTKAAEAEKLYVTLGVLIGLMLALIVI